MINKDYIQILISKLAKYDWISFDVFDTLLCRNVPDPKLIFEIVELKAIKNEIKDGEFFKERRASAFKLAVSHSETGEVTFNNIYDFIEGYDEKDLQKLKKIELDTEADFLQVNRRIFEIYLWCLHHNKHIIAISDMYLDSHFIDSLLKKNGIFCEKIYVSNEIGYNKQTGKIFDAVIEDLKIDKMGICHIGDSFKSDYLSPRIQGWHSYHTPKIQYRKNESNLQGKIIDAIIKNNPQNDLFFNLGFNTLGPLLLGFSQWLHKSIIDDKIDSLLFLARDGKIMKATYDVLYSKEIKTYYCYLSRQTLNTATLWFHPEFDSLRNYIVITPFFNIKTFINRLGLEAENYFGEIENYQIDIEYSYEESEFWKSPKIKLFYEHIKTDVILNSKKQYNYLLEYLSPYIKGKNIGIVDIGWRGSMQKRLVDIFNYTEKYKNIYLKGYYLGIEENSDLCSGFLYNTASQTKEKTIIDASVGLIESFFLAREGTALSFHMEGQKVVPSLAEYEVTDNKIKKNLINIHGGAIAFVSQYNKLNISEIYNSSIEIFFSYYQKIALKPSKREVVEFKDIPFNDTTNSTLIKSKGIFYYIMHPQKLKADYKCAAWKIGFLNQNLSSKIPWGDIYMKLKNMKG